jgi:hypothetical protein
MVNLDKNTIEAIDKISKSLEGTVFFINRFEVSESGIGKTVINLDIREKTEEKK